VPIGQKAHQHAADDLPLPDDHALDRVQERVYEGAFRADALVALFE
jgi:hypothetical protein